MIHRGILILFLLSVIILLGVSFAFFSGEIQKRNASLSKQRSSTVSTVYFPDESTLNYFHGCMEKLISETPTLYVLTHFHFYEVKTHRQCAYSASEAVHYICAAVIFVR